MKYQKIKKRNRIIIISLLIILLCSLIVGYNFYNNKKISIIEENSIEEFFNDNGKEEIEKYNYSIDEKNNNIEIKNNKYSKVMDYIAILEIPKIKLKRGLFDKNSPQNNVDKNIYIIKETTFPDEQGNSHIILASHSGNSFNSYFKKINKLNINDEVYFYYKNIKYIYKIIDRYEIEKKGSMSFKMTNNANLTLITCIGRTNRQLVLVANLIDKEEY